MADPRLGNLARTLVQYSTKIQPEEYVAIGGTALAEPLIAEVYRQVLRAGAYPYPLVSLDGAQQIFFTEANDDQLRHVSRIQEMVFGEFDAAIFIESVGNTRSLSNVDPGRQQVNAKAYTDVMEAYNRRTATGEFKWVITMFPTEAYAQDAEMSLGEFEDYVYGATYADTEDPVAVWQSIHDDQERLIGWLKDRKRVEVRGPNVDLRLSIEGREFLNGDGTFNMPSGEIYTSPVEDSVNGWVRFDYPAIRLGREVKGIELRFEQGRVVEAKAEKNEGYLLSMLEVDAGARYLGEWAIGANKRIDRFIKAILFDEKIGGTIHMAIGSGFPKIGGQNRSAVHWDMICEMRDGGQIIVDGELIYESGEFKI